LKVGAIVGVQFSLTNRQMARGTPNGIVGAFVDMDGEKACFYIHFVAIRTRACNETTIA
jgi:hypothetical protein